MNYLRKMAMRRNYIVDRKVQYNLLLRTLGFVVFMLLIVSAGLYIPLVVELRQHAGELDASYETSIALMFMQERFWPVALFCLAFAAYGTIVISHRIVGPLVRVKRVMKSIGDGRLPTTLQIRSKDYLKTEVEILNTMVAGLAEQVDRIKGTNQRLADSLAACQEDAARYGNEQLQSSLGDVTAAAQTLSQELAFFQREAQAPHGDPAAASSPAEETAISAP